jgi:putative flavoprotein involved in K+ transport
MNTHNHDVVVIGGGQAGLAIGRHLAEQGRDFVILDAETEPAAAWRARWDSLRLFTAARYDALPGRPFPGDPDHYPSRDEVVEYLTAYAQDLPVDLDIRAQRLVPIDGGYRGRARGSRVRGGSGRGGHGPVPVAANPGARA